VTHGGESLRAAGQLLLVTLPRMLGPVLAVFAMIGLLAKSTLPRDGKGNAVLGIAAATQFAAAALSTYAEPRYVMVTVIALALWSARGAWILTQRMEASARWRPLRHIPAASIAAMMLIGISVNIVPSLLGHQTYKPLEYKIAGQWMKMNLEPGLIFSRKPQVGYYANMPTSGPAPEDSLDEMKTRVTDAGMHYVVVDERYSTQMIPALRPLLDPASAPPWLRVLKADLSPYPDARIVIYEVVQNAAAQ
jgi:hypothetical protein